MAPVEGALPQVTRNEGYNSRHAPQPMEIVTEHKETNVFNVGHIQPQSGSDIQMHRIPCGSERTKDDTLASHSNRKRSPATHAESNAKHDPEKTQDAPQRQLEAVHNRETDQPILESCKKSDNLQEALVDDPATQKMSSKTKESERAPAIHGENRSTRDYMKQLEVMRKREAEYEEHARQARNECDFLRDDLARTKKDIAALRDQVKLVDVMETKQAVLKFDQILVAIGDLGFSISDGFDGISHLTTSDINPDWDIWQDLLTTPLQSLWKSGAGQNWPLHELIEHSVRVIINSRLDETIFARFHPCLSPERPESKIITGIYTEICKEEPQIVFGAFRANMFKGIDHLYGNRQEELASHFVHAVRHDWTKVLGCLPQSNNEGSILEKHLVELKDIYLKAYEWNGRVKLDCISLDFHPRIYPPQKRFDDEVMNGRIKGNKRPKTIICTVGFGLSSSISVGKGRSQKFACQTKAVVLSEIYFLQNN